MELLKKKKIFSHGTSAGRLDYEKSPFTESVKVMVPDDVCEPATTGIDLTEIKPKLLRWAIIFVCAVVFCVSAVYVINTLSEYAKMQRANDALSDMLHNDGSWAMSMPFKSVETPDYAKAQTIVDWGKYVDPPTLTEEELYARYRAKLGIFKAAYPDFFGWVQVEGTNIDYIIMQSKDNDFYLNHDYTGNYSKGGSIFADYRCSKTIPDNRNLILYGHHMSNSTMFHMLDRYTEKNFFDRHRYVLIHTPEASYKYEVFAAYQTTSNYPYIRTSFANDADFLKFAEEMRSNSVWKQEGIKFDKNSRLLTLSTCTNRAENGRIAVQAVLIKTYTD